MRVIDSAYNALKSKILAQEYPPGMRLREMPIAAELGLTRTPVREAIIKLEREGLVKTIYNQGAFVATFSKEEIDDIFEVREALEAKAIYLATMRASKEDIAKVEKTLKQRDEFIRNGVFKADYCDDELDFHFIIIRLSKNDRLVSLWKTLQSQLSLMRITYPLKKNEYSEGFKDHKRIFAFISKGDFKNAVKLTKRHIEYSKRNLYPTYSENHMIR